MGLVAVQRPALACGGCFAPPQDNTVVTDHRMVLSISPQKTTLYDQIRYQGSPASFAWVLPIVGTVDVGVSADALFSTLDSATAVQVIAPPLNCPPPPYCPGTGRGFASSMDASAAATPGGVTVLKQETVGPYETVQLRSTDPQALNTWLADHGYTIPSDVAPVIASYVTEHFDFLALKLVPGATVQAMRPVRVTTQGASPTLPLRMVAAGTGAVVGITLWTVGDGKWEPQNFPVFSIREDELIWDWTTSSSNFKTLRSQKAEQLGGAAWESESSVWADRQGLRSSIFSRDQARTYDPRTMQSTEAAAEYKEVRDADGKLVKTATDVFNEDMAALLGGSTGTTRISRMRADLPRASLANDLLLRAAVDQAVLSGIRTVTKEANEPQCPIYSGCEYVGTASRSEAQARLSESSGCSSTPGVRSWGSVVGLCGVGLIAALARRRIRRTR